MGSFSGCPYLSAHVYNDEDILAEALYLAHEGAIDPLENILGDKIFIYQGLLDTVVPWGKYVASSIITQAYFNDKLEKNLLLSLHGEV